MIHIISKILVATLALLIVARFVPGIMIDGLYIAVITALVLGLLNVLVKPVLVVLTLPITVVTLGLFIFVINAGLFWFVASFVDGFQVDSFFTAFIGSVLVSVISAIGNKFIN